MPLVDGLNFPTAVAVQPETGDLFVAESGALRIVRIVDKQIEPVIVGFPQDTFGKSPIYEIGPLSLLFLDKDTLLVGGGGNPAGKDLLRVYKIPAKGAEPIQADNVYGDTMGLPESGEVGGEGNFFAMVKGSRGVYVTSEGDPAKGWVSLATLDGENRLLGLTRQIATVEAISRAMPFAITISPLGHLTVGQRGTNDDQKDSQLTFYSEAGAMLDNFPLGINDVSGLAYGPKHGRLFATDFHWAKTQAGGLYKIVATKDAAGCKPVLLATLDGPTALAFSSDGSELFVTLGGDPLRATAGKPTGKVVVFKDLDVDNTQ